MHALFPPAAATAVALLLHVAAPAHADQYAVFRSLNRGETWERTDSGLPSASRVNALGATRATLLAGTDAGVFVSRNRGTSWHRPEGNGSAPIRVLSIATAGSTVFAGTDGSGIRTSNDEGRTWTNAPGLGSFKVRSLLAHGGTVYAGTDSNGVHASADGGRTWRHLAAGFPADAQVFALSRIGDRIFAGLYADGLVAWDEASGRWTSMPPVKPLALGSDGKSLIAGHNPGGLFWSIDKGATWTRGRSEGDSALGAPFKGDPDALPAEAPVWEMGSSDGLVLAGAAAGVYRSTDGGKTWTRSANGLPSGAPGIAFHVAPGIAVAGVRIGP